MIGKTPLKLGGVERTANTRRAEQTQERLLLGIDSGIPRANAGTEILEPSQVEMLLRDRSAGGGVL